MKRDGCPPPAELRRYLEQSFDTDPPPDDPIADHLSRCSVCRRMLEENTEERDAQHWRQLWANRRKFPAKMIPGDVSAVPGQDAQQDDSPQPVVVEGFEILGVLGRGGSGVVYKALQVRLNRTVALKMLAAGAHATPRARSRLRAESETIARFKHPNVVTIHDVGEHQGVPYLCLELVEGGSLADWLSNRTEPLPPSEAARVVAALARVVQEAHNLGIIHRDLKPANVLLTGPLDVPLDTSRLKLTDFGLAKRLVEAGPPSNSSSGLILGTPSYMAPEQAGAGKTEVGRAVDVYGLGAILYELLTLRAPFRGESPFETVLQVLSQTPERPSRHNPAIPAGLEAICLQCLEKDPARRFASASELGDHLDRFASGLPLNQSGPTPRVRSRAGLAATVGAGLAAVALFAAVCLFSFDQLHPSASPKPPSPAKIDIMAPPGGVSLTQGVDYHEKGRIGLSPPAETAWPAEDIAFDLSSDHHLRYLDTSLTKNARCWTEPDHDITYWGPIDDGEWFEVVYRFPFEFPVRAASLHASVNLAEAGAAGFLHVSTDPREGWTEVARQSTLFPGGGPFDVSEIVRGARQIYVRARMKGRDDHDGSCMAQFLRTSTAPDGHRDCKSPYVFELRAFDREVPILTASLACSDGGSRRLWVGLDGEFSVDHVFDKPGQNTCTITARAGKLEASKSFDLWINSRGWRPVIDPNPLRIHLGETYRAEGKLSGAGSGPWSGVVDYADGSGKQALTVTPDGRVRLEHRYRTTGKHLLRVTIRDDAGDTVTDRPTCIVVPPP